MSVNWAMIEHSRPVCLPNEQFVYAVPNVKFQLSKDSHKIGCSDSIVHVSNQRMVIVPGAGGQGARYTVPGRGDREFKSFSVLHKRTFGQKVVQPWIGPNSWQAHVLVVPDGGLNEVSGDDPNQNNLWTLKLVFTSGGVFEFDSKMQPYVSLNNSRQDEEEALPAYSET